MLPENLVAQLRERAANPKTRSDASQSSLEAIQDMARPAPRPTRMSMSDATGDGTFGGLMQLAAGALSSGRGFNPQKLAEQVAEDVRTGKTSMDDVFPGAQPGAGIEIWDDEQLSGHPRELLPPASQEDIATAESTFGFSLPEDLKQLYTSIANGGFGPSAGFLSLAEMAARYREFRSEPQGPCDEMWPDHLLPVIPVDAGEACYDLKTGNIIYWDWEELVDEDAEGEAWDRSFIFRADSLGEWLQTWLAKEPLIEQLADQHEKGMLQNVRNSIDCLQGMTPEERSEMGLPVDGWEEQICRNHGVDPKDVL